MKILILLAGAVAAMVVAAPALADCLPASASDPQQDAAGRAVANVFVNDQGPFRFIVDTGANRSVLSSDLVRRLGLAPFGSGEVHTLTDMRVAPFAHVRSLRFGAVALSDLDAPVLDGPMLAGEQGMLGFDGMAGRLLQIDFANRCVEVSDAEAAATRLVGWSMVQGRLRFGSMLMARGEIQGVGVNVLVDTGSDMSLCNAAFRAALASVRAEWVQYQEGRAFTAGRPLYARDSIWTPTLRLGRVRVRSVTAYQGEYHIFALWGLQDQPTLLLGMDVIRAAGGLAIDYRRNAIYFRTPPHGAS